MEGGGEGGGEGGLGGYMGGKKYERRKGEEGGEGGGEKEKGDGGREPRNRGKYEGKKSGGGFLKYKKMGMGEKSE